MADRVAEPRRRVLVISPDFPPARGGIQQVIERIVAHNPDLEMVVVTTSSPGARAFDSRQPYRIRRVPGRARAPRLAIGLLNAAALLQGLTFRPRVVLSAHVVAGPAAFLTGRLAGAGTIQYLHADEIRVAPPLSRFALRSADRVVAVSSHARDLALGAGARDTRIAVIPPGVDLLAAREAAADREERPTLLTVARLEDDYKGHDVVLRSMPAVLERFPDAQWIVVGDGSLRVPLEGLANELDVAGNVRFLGALSDAERDSWYERAHVFVMPSRLPAEGGGEGFGIVYLEAALRGLPAIAADVGGSADAVVDGETGLLVDPADPDAVAAAINRLLGDPDLARRLGTAGRSRAETFAWPLVASRVRALIDELADEPRRFLRR